MDAMEVRFVDTTFRDGSQSLWASGMRTGMIEAVAEEVAQAGFDVVEVPFNPIFIKKFVRDLKEDPWEMGRRVARKMPHAVKACMGGGGVGTMGRYSPKALARLFNERIFANGILNRFQMFANTAGQMDSQFPWAIPMCKEIGFQVAIALSYALSPRHTDEYYAKTMRRALEFKPDVIYMEDQCGVLTLDRARTLFPVLVENANGMPLEFHAHCTTGLAPLIYLEALKFGIRTLHTAIPPLAEGPGQPSVFSIVRNARLLGFTPAIDETVLHPVEERLTAIAQQEKLPIGAPLPYDYAQYIHQMPGGVISNLQHQLAELGIQHRLDEVLDETVQVRKELGYPIMITPYSQYVSTQAAINVAVGERYKFVLDEVIQLARGAYGDDSGYTWMDQDLKDKLLSLPRAAELAARNIRELSLEEIRSTLGGTGVSDEELLLRYVMEGEREIEAMRAAGPPKQYFTGDLPLVTLLQELDKNDSVRYIHVQRGSDALMLHRGSAAAAEQ
ncbi:MAG: hypothetical protein KGJ86_09150 [Chloroflexota bacterium]|nr:hypothetical protein [Chloroflexota bacterium]